MAAEAQPHNESAAHDDASAHGHDEQHETIEGLAHDIPNQTDFFGLTTINLPIYDVVFISLGVFTAVEVVIGTLTLPEAWLWVKIALLAGIAFVKAFHVVWFYMHLKSDNKIFWLTLMLPFLIAAVGLLYLTAVHPVLYPY